MKEGRHCQGQSGGRLTQAETPAKVTVLRQECAWCVLRTARKPGRLTWNGGQVKEGKVRTVKQVDLVALQGLWEGFRPSSE